MHPGLKHLARIAGFFGDGGEDDFDYAGGIKGGDGRLGCSYGHYGCRWRDRHDGRTGPHRNRCGYGERLGCEDDGGGNWGSRGGGGRDGPRRKRSGYGSCGGGEGGAGDGGEVGAVGIAHRAEEGLVGARDGGLQGRISGGGRDGSGRIHGTRNGSGRCGKWDGSARGWRWGECRRGSGDGDDDGRRNRDGRSFLAVARGVGAAEVVATDGEGGGGEFFVGARGAVALPKEVPRNGEAGDGELGEGG